ITVPSRISMKRLPATSSASPRWTSPVELRALANPLDTSFRWPAVGIRHPFRTSCVWAHVALLGCPRDMTTARRPPVHDQKGAGAETYTRRERPGRTGPERYASERGTCQPTMTSPADALAWTARSSRGAFPAARTDHEGRKQL